METLTFSDGTVLQNSSAVKSGDLFLYINGISMKDVFDLLIDSEITEQISYTMNNGETVTYNNFQHLIAVRDEDNGLVTAVLRKAVE